MSGLCRHCVQWQVDPFRVTLIVMYGSLLYLFQNLACQVSSSQLELGCLYPPLQDIREVSVKVAVRVMETAYSEGLATIMPEPEDKEALLRPQLYNPDYMSYIPETYAWPNKSALWDSYQYGDGNGGCRAAWETESGGGIGNCMINNFSWFSCAFITAGTIQLSAEVKNVTFFWIEVWFTKTYIVTELSGVPCCIVMDILIQLKKWWSEKVGMGILIY